MSDKPEHVLLRGDLKPGFDEAAALEAMAAMAEEAGEEAWWEHVPYAAARAYRDDPEIVAEYEAHVDECPYCQKLIQALNPSVSQRSVFRKLLRAVRDQSEEQGMGAWVAMGTGATLPVSTVYAGFIANPECLEVFEAEEDMTSKFKAARIYLGTTQPWMAYKRIGEGCAQADIGVNVMEYLASAATPVDDPAGSVAESARTLRELWSRRPLEGEGQLQMFGALANLGWHRMAMDSLRAVLDQRVEGAVVVEALKAAELVDMEPWGEERTTWKVLVGALEEKSGEVRVADRLLNDIG